MINILLEADLTISQKMRLPQDAKLARSFAIFFAHSGDSWFWLAALFIIWLLKRNPSHAISALMAFSILLLAVIVLTIKFIVRRQRPEGEWGAIYRNTDPHSFPSGHAARAVLMAGLCWALGIQPLAWILTFWVPLVSLARVMMGVHYLVDVIAGWLLGLLMIPVILALQPFLFSFFPMFFLI
jgi:membrane-associated phospholipid phosphatase